MQWCCIGFENMWERVGKRGAAILIDASDQASMPGFFVQFRAVDTGIEPKLPDDAPVSVVTEIGIAFCPWCGVSLREFYGTIAARISRSEFRIGLGRTTRSTRDSGRST